MLYNLSCLIVFIFILSDLNACVINLCYILFSYVYLFPSFNFFIIVVIVSIIVIVVDIVVVVIVIFLLFLLMSLMLLLLLMLLFTYNGLRLMGYG